MMTNNPLLYESTMILEKYKVPCISISTKNKKNDEIDKCTNQIYRKKNRGIKDCRNL